jgi:hypothetical protein
MARRSKDWNKGLAQDIENVEFVREFLLAEIDEGMSLQQAQAKSLGLRE